MTRMELVLKAKYGEVAYNASKQPNWKQKANQPTYHKFPKQGLNQCGFYCLMYDFQYDGERLIGNIQKQNNQYPAIQENDVS